MNPPTDWATTWRAQLHETTRRDWADALARVIGGAA